MMELNDIQKAVLSGKRCPSCKCETVKVSSHTIYPNRPDYGNFWQCPQCKDYVGCHKGTDKALGRVAGTALRAAKGRAHKAFDVLWKDGQMSRTEAYKWLSEQLNIPIQYTHIGMFSIETCEKVVLLSKSKTC